MIKIKTNLGHKFKFTSVKPSMLLDVFLLKKTLQNIFESPFSIHFHIILFQRIHHRCLQTYMYLIMKGHTLVKMYRLANKKEKGRLHTVSKLQDFSVTQILCEINYQQSRSSKTAILPLLDS